MPRHKKSVQDLIDKLLLIEDKSKPVWFQDENTGDFGYLFEVSLDTRESGSDDEDERYHPLLRFNF